MRAWDRMATETSSADDREPAAEGTRSLSRAKESGSETAMATPNRILMIAYHYPPCSVSSGLQRTLSFSRHLPAYGWAPIIVSAHPRVYERTSSEQLSDIPASVLVKRPFALDTAVHVAFRGRYFNWMALPDRWVSWLIGAVPAGLNAIWRYRPRLLWSTYPIATAHLVAFVLHRLTGIPWIADFRDPMVEMDPVTKQEWPIDPAIRKARSWVERLTLAHCSRAVLASPGSLRIYADRYRDVPPEHMTVIRNGYEENSFAEARQSEPARHAQNGQIVLLHSGVLYPSPDRHPGAFLSALGALKRSGKISPSNVKVVLRASSYEAAYRALIRQEGLEGMVYLEPPIAYRAALTEMLQADGLLVFQGHDSNPAIPAKIYEYFRARRPVFAMVDPEGDTAGELRSARVGQLVPLDSSERIAEGLSEFLVNVRKGTAPVMADAELHHHSREAKTAELAELLDGMIY